MELCIEVEGKMYKLCGKVDLSILTYTTPDEPEIEKGEQVLTFKNCTCQEDETEGEWMDERTILN
jgi:hypothetical protein